MRPRLDSAAIRARCVNRDGYNFQHVKLDVISPRREAEEHYKIVLTTILAHNRLRSVQPNFTRLLPPCRFPASSMASTSPDEKAAAFAATTPRELHRHLPRRHGQGVCAQQWSVLSGSERQCVQNSAMNAKGEGFSHAWDAFLVISNIWRSTQFANSIETG